MRNWLKQLGGTLTRNGESLSENLNRLFLGNPKIDDALLEEFEATLISADFGVSATTRILTRIKTSEQLSRNHSVADVKSLVQEAIVDIMKVCKGYTEMIPPPSCPIPYVYMIVGVNGVGKTTTIAKLAHRAVKAGNAAVLVAADTFRAAAIDQLQVWGRRVNADVIRHHHGSDPAAVVHDGMTAAKNRNAKVVIIDTAGRLQTKHNLMSELEKMKRVMARVHPGSPHEVLLILDATTGQNALSQARQFKTVIGVTGIVLTKLDGTAKGGIVAAIVEELHVPVKWVGVGEGMEDFHQFDVVEFAEHLVQASNHVP